MKKLEQKQGNFVAEVNASRARAEVSACRDELARLKTEAEHKVHLATTQLSALLASVEAGVRGQTQRAAHTESDGMSASRLQQ